MKSLFVTVLVLLVGCGRGALNEDVDAGTNGGNATGGGFAMGGGSGDGGMTSTCDALDLLGCRARTDCEADFCFACSCTPNFKSCRARTAAAATCPGLGCAQPLCCQNQSDCSNVGACGEPGTHLSCGACNPQPSTCTDDTSCDATSICEARNCACGGERDCVPGCSATNPCPAGSTCSGKRCVVQTCSPTMSCPSTFDCLTGQCSRRTCTTDAHCGTGFCVNNSCFEAFGTCQQLVP
jgi:hypothetical protein